jgi:hypothetical protein
VHSVVPDGGEVVLVRRDARRERDHALVGVSGFRGSKEFVSFSDCATNMLTALRERVFYHVVQGVASAPHVPQREVVQNILTGFMRKVRRAAFVSIPVPVLEYPACYTGSRRALYERAAQKVSERGWSKGWSVLKTFIKHEKIEATPGKRLVPRVIQPRAPEYNVVVGRYLRHLEHPIYRIIDSICGGPTVMKGYNAFEVGGHMAAAWGEFRKPVGIGLDASRFDQHISRPILEWEHSVYALFYKGEDRAEIARALQCQLVNTGFASTPDGTYRYQREGCRASGDMNTALGNCLVMCAMVYAYMHSIHVAKWRLLNNGDDCVVIVEDGDLPKFASLPTFFGSLGFIMTVEEPVRVLEQVEFCQTHPVWDGVAWRMVRNVRTAISKDSTMLQSFRDDVEYAHYRYVVAQGGLSLCCGIPMMQQYYETFGRGSCAGTMRDQRILESGFLRLAHGLQAKQLPISDDARVSFWRAFGFTPSEQLAWEDTFAEALPMATTSVEGAAEHWWI